MVLVDFKKTGGFSGFSFFYLKVVLVVLVDFKKNR